STRSFAGPTRLREALVRSRNLVSIRILKDLGVGTAIDYIARFGFDPRSMPHDLTLALGTLQATPLDVAAGYAVFANGGYRVTPYFIDRIEDGSGAVVSRAAPRMVCAQCDEGGAQSVGAEPLRVSDPAHGEPAPLPADQERQRPRPEGLVTWRISPQTGTLVSAENADGVPEIFMANHLPDSGSVAQGPEAQASGEPIF